MIGELIDYFIIAAGIQLLQGNQHLAMPHTPLAAQQVAVDRFASQCVAEAEVVFWAAGIFDHQLALDQQVDGAQQLGFAKAG